jgi:hypothetical protein
MDVTNEWMEVTNAVDKSFVKDVVQLKLVPIHYFEELPFQ